MNDLTKKKLSTVLEEKMTEKELAEMESEESEDKSKKEEEKPQKLSIIELIKFCNTTDFILIGVGFIGSGVSAAMWPLLNIYFAEVVNIFAKFEGDWAVNKGNASKENELRDNFLHEVYMNSLALSIITAGFIVGGFVMLTTFQRFSLRLMRLLKQKYFTSILAQEVAWHDEQNSGEFASKITSDFKKLESGVNENLGLFLQNIMCFFFNLIIGLVKGWKLALITIAFTPITGIVGAVVAKLSTKWTDLSSKASAEASTSSEEAISAIRTVYAFNGQKKEITRYESSLRRAMSSGVKLNFISSFGMASAWGSMYASFAVGIWYGGKLILDGEYDIGQVMLVFWSIISAGMNMGTAAPYFEALQIALSSAFSIFKIIERQSMVDPFQPEGDKIDKDKFRANIELHNVHFAYPSRPNVEVLKGVNLRVASGEIVALVGPSGCGKSSIIQMIQRFYDPNAGAVLVDGHDVRQLNVGWLREQMGVVGQEPVLFDDTIAENIRLGAPHERMSSIDVKDIHQVALEANATDFIDRLPQRFETNVGERGTQLSGGQKQRIAIARALISKPKILLLDEATSAIDMRSEEIVQAALDRAVRGRTTIIVAHRLSTIRNAHRIVYIQEGRVLEEGTHDNLMEARGAYFELVTGQQVHRASVQSEGGQSDEQDDDDHDDDVLFPPRKESNRRSSTKEKIEFTKSEEDETDKKTKQKPPAFPYLRLLKIIWADKIFLIIGLLAALAYGGLTPAYAWIFGRYVDVIVASVADNKTKDDTMTEIILCSVYYIVLAITAFTVTVTQISLFGYISEHLCLKLRLAAYRAIMGSEIAFFDVQDNSPGALCSRLSDDAANIQEATGMRISMFFQAFSTLLISVAISFYYNWKMALVSLGMVPFIVISSTISGDLFMGQAVKNSKASAMASKLAIEVMNAIRTVVSLHKEQYFTGKFLKDLTDNFRILGKKVYIKSLVVAIALGIPFFVYTIAIIFGGNLIAQRSMSSGEFFTIIESVLFGSMVIGQAVIMSGNMAKAKNAASNIFKLIDRPTTELPMGTVVVVNDNKPSHCKGEITFEQVNFSYPNRADARVLNGLSFTAKVGQTVALVGESGSGKSTTVQLIEQFYQPSTGRILLDGRAMQSFPVDWCRAQMALVQQEPILFSYSIRENIAYGDLARQVSQDEIVAAARMANIHDFIAQLPEGYDTPVGSKGVASLSGGQKQRVAIARALIRNPQIVLLDEATSALDNESEKLVQQALDKAAKDRTCIVIAHRLKTIVNADKIIVFARGGVKVEEGTHKELIESKGFYYKLYNSAMSNMVA